MVTLYEPSAGAASGTLTDSYANYKYLLVSYAIECENSESLTGTRRFDCSNSALSIREFVTASRGTLAVAMDIYFFTNKNFRTETTNTHGYAWYICDNEAYDYDVTFKVTKVVGVK